MERAALSKGLLKSPWLSINFPECGSNPCMSPSYRGFGPYSAVTAFTQLGALRKVIAFKFESVYVKA